MHPQRLPGGSGVITPKRGEQQDSFVLMACFDGVAVGQVPWRGQVEGKSFMRFSCSTLPG
jgi:hypothetical protein